MSLKQYEQSIRSQSGEDGIIQHIFNQIGTTNKQLIEIGFDNTCNSFNLLGQGWQGLLIDMNIHNIEYAKKWDCTNGKMHLLNAWVTRENIDELLTEYSFGNKPDLLSIDIDGMDWHIWNATKTVNPKVVIIEYNASFGPELNAIVPYNPHFNRFVIDPLYHGASLTALTKLAESKGYGLIGCESTGNNAFYVKKDYPLKFVSVKEAFVDHEGRKPWRESLEILKHYPLEKL